ncbi:PilN domain-containing protein [Harryflintia acetispora]|uniref:PilN domain-containing protein n=1 Tax=Harryflintia acetispora TaxID=1849041 RepID=UPI00189B2E64|nr:PilN domain-containing protein [Harryflintia acetispora]
MQKLSKLQPDSVLRAAASTLLALTLALAFYLCGTGLGNWCLQLQKNYRIELFNRAVEDRGLVVKMISDEETHAIASHYISALADAVIRFEFFPREDDASTFFEIISILPPKVEITQFEFSGRNLLVHCTAQKEEQLVQFSQALDSVSRFRDISLESYQKTDGSFIGTITCISR